ncbi:MAG: branched-chain amino acid aminotransferase [Pseudomonadota bacterium]
MSDQPLQEPIKSGGKPMTDPNARTWTWVQEPGGGETAGAWHEGNPSLIGPRSHAFWLGSSVFDGARAFEGVAPDLDLHCARTNASARALGLEPTLSGEAITGLAREGIAKFGPKPELYIRPMYWAEQGGPSTVMPDPASTRFCLCLYEVPMPNPDAMANKGTAVTLSPFRRPMPDAAPVDAKAGCLYPNPARALGEARARGFDNAVMRDALGNVAELASANVFMAKGGEVHTPAPNGTFLNGLTRQRIIALFRTAGVTVHERTLAYADLQASDELFSTGNYSKVMPITRIEDRAVQPGPLGRQARQLYWDFAHGRL